jgi:hypothetical protein
MTTLDCLNTWPLNGNIRLFKYLTTYDNIIWKIFHPFIVFTSS